MFHGKNVKRSAIDIDDNMGQAVIDDNHLVRYNIQDMEELKNGAIIYASLHREVGEHSYCIERYKAIVEAPTFWERLIGIKREDKIRRAIKKIKDQCINTIDEKSANRFGQFFTSPNFYAFIV